MLHEFLLANRDQIILRTRARVAKRMGVGESDENLSHGVPLFLNQLIEILRHLTCSHEELFQSATRHGSELLQLGFTVGQVIQCYGDVCQVVTDLAVERGVPISADDFGIFNKCLDDAVCHAVTEYGRQREQSIVDEGTERLGFLAHELRNLLNTAMLSFEALKSGNVGPGGRTSQLLGRSLVGLRNLIDRSLAEVRLGAGIAKREPVLMAEFIEELEIAAAVEAKLRDIQFSVSKIEHGLKVEVDRALLRSAVENLLQNAFKFTPVHGHVSLKVSSIEERVLIAIEDECGGLTMPDPEELFSPFKQHSCNRTGLGLGLAICRQAITANGGKVQVRNLPGKGCVFTVELPRLASLPAKDADAAVAASASPPTPTL